MLTQKTTMRETVSQRLIGGLISSCNEDAQLLEQIYLNIGLPKPRGAHIDFSQGDWKKLSFRKTHH
ncbi:MAG: hypothetical protein ABIG39_05635 [Candidatus Micrarchaeota archaeon]